MLTLRRALALAAVVVATLAGGYLALVSFRQDHELSVGTIRLSVSPGHKGALDIYVPLVDWGARFEAIRLPARLRVDLRTIDRDVVKGVADGGRLDVRQVRKEARDAIATYLRDLILAVLLCGGSLGVLVAFAVRGGATPKLRYTTGTAVGTAIIAAAVLITLLPPRGPIDTPQYYAFGPDIPRALEAVETAQRSTRALDQELDAQLVGLARLVTAPANRPALEDRPRLTRRQRPAQQRAHPPDPRAHRRARARLLRRRPDRSRQPARSRPHAAGRPHRQAVRVRGRQPRLGQPHPRPRARRRDRARRARAG